MRRRARELCSTGAAAPGSAAHVVVEWADPWTRPTPTSAGSHAFYPPAVRARIAAVLRLGYLLSRKDPRCADYPPQAMVDAFEASLVKHVAAAAYWR